MADYITPVRQAVLFAAGRGRRMMPLTAELPKPMLEYDGRPLVARVFDSLPVSIEEVVVVVGWKGEEIVKYLGEEFLGRNVRYVWQRVWNGTGGALLRCHEDGVLDQRFLVLYADDQFLTEDLERLCGVEVGVMASNREHDGRVRTLEVTDSGCLGGIREMREGERSAIVFTGAAVLDSSIFEYDFLPVPGASEELSLPDTVLAMAGDKCVDVVMTEWWVSVTKPEDLK